jgi:hypothetical protein
MSGTLKVLKSKDRGQVNNGWLKASHTFSFGTYHNPKYSEFGSLHVINEDRISPKKGFPTHPHENYEIFSYVIAGEMEHKDSLGNVETISRGDVQFTSAGSGVQHSEFNAHKTKTLHLLQIWVQPNTTGLKPSYSTKHYSDEEKKNKLRAIVAPNGGKLDCITIHQDLTTYACILEKSNVIEYKLAPKRKLLLQMITTSPNVGMKLTSGDETVQLKGGDVLQVYESNKPSYVTIEGDSEVPTEFLFFDVGK